MKIEAARRLLSKDIYSMPLEKLQRHRVALIDAWRQSRADNGMADAIRDGFYVPVIDPGADGYTPVDIWLSHNLSRRIDEATALERALLSHPELK